LTREGNLVYCVYVSADQKAYAPDTSDFLEVIIAGVTVKCWAAEKKSEVGQKPCAFDIVETTGVSTYIAMEES